jgi:microcystin-dependent protein
MAQPFVGEIRMFGGNFAPVGWMFCDGSTVAISEFQTLFQLIGTTYGGDGQSTFQLPDLRGRIPLHMGTGSDGTTHIIGENGGVENVTLTTQQIPVHTHPLTVSGDVAQQTNPSGAVPGQSTQAKLYVEFDPNVALNAQTVGPSGGSQPHNNMQPFLGINFIISMFGVFPTQT